MRERHDRAPIVVKKHAYSALKFSADGDGDWIGPQCRKVIYLEFLYDGYQTTTP